MKENELSYLIRGCIYEVYNKLGPGLLESIYQKALLYELDKKELNAKSEVPVEVIYDDVNLGLGFRIDILVEDKVIIELKSVEQLAKVHYKQTLTYLKLTNLKLALLVNFNDSNINQGIARLVNNLR